MCDGKQEQKAVLLVRVVVGSTTDNRDKMLDIQGGPYSGFDPNPDENISLFPKQNEGAFDYSSQSISGSVSGFSMDNEYSIGMDSCQTCLPGPVGPSDASQEQASEAAVPGPAAVFSEYVGVSSFEVPGSRDVSDEDTEEQCATDQVAAPPGMMQPEQDVQPLQQREGASCKCAPEEEDEELKPKEREMKRKGIRVWIPTAELQRLTMDEWKEHRRMFEQQGPVTADEDEVFKWQKKRVKNRVAAANHRKRDQEARENCKRYGEREKEHLAHVCRALEAVRELQGCVARVAADEREKRALERCTVTLEGMLQGLRDSLEQGIEAKVQNPAQSAPARLESVASAPVQQQQQQQPLQQQQQQPLLQQQNVMWYGATAAAAAPRVSQSPIIASTPALCTPRVSAYTGCVHRQFTPLQAPEGAPQSKRARLRTPALFFFGMVALVLLVAQLTVLEARTNPASAHPLARAFHAPGALGQAVADALAQRWAPRTGVPYAVVQHVVPAVASNRTRAEGGPQCCLGLVLDTARSALAGVDTDDVAGGGVDARLYDVQCCVVHALALQDNTAATVPHEYFPEAPAT